MILDRAEPSIAEIVERAKGRNIGVRIIVPRDLTYSWVDTAEHYDECVRVTAGNTQISMTPAEYQALRYTK